MKHDIRLVKPFNITFKEDTCWQVWIEFQYWDREKFGGSPKTR